MKTKPEHCYPEPAAGYVALDPEKYPAIANKGNLTTKQLLLLAAAEEAYSQASVVLQPVISELCNIWNEGHYDDVFEPEISRVRTGLALLEEAMLRHNHYMDSLQ